MEDVRLAKRSKLGIISGSGPEAGLDLWKKILEENRLALGSDFGGDLDAPHVVIHSVPGLGLSMEMAQYEKRVWNILEATIHKISKEVDFFCIACNTLNYFRDKINSLDLSAKFVSFSDVVSSYLRSPANEGQTTVLLGARPVAALGKWSPYRHLAEDMNFEKVGNLDEWHALIEDIKKFGGNHPPLIMRFQSLLNSLTANTVLLACTELPLLPVHMPDKSLVDVTRLVAKEMVRKSEKTADSPQA